MAGLIHAITDLAEGKPIEWHEGHVADLYTRFVNRVYLAKPNWRERKPLTLTAGELEDTFSGVGMSPSHVKDGYARTVATNLIKDSRRMLLRKYEDGVTDYLLIADGTKEWSFQTWLWIKIDWRGGNGNEVIRKFETFEHHDSPGMVDMIREVRITPQEAVKGMGDFAVDFLGWAWQGTRKGSKGRQALLALNDYAERLKLVIEAIDTIPKHHVRWWSDI